MAQYKQVKLSVLLVASTFSTLSYGAGFAIQEQSVTGLGRAFAGSAAVAEDASTIFFNPAGLTQLKHTEIDFGIHYIKPKSDFSDDGSTVPNLGGGGFFGQALTGGGDDAGKEALVPNLYYAQPLNDKVVVGLGINAPFGLVTEYDDTWKGRYHAVKSDLMTININPTIAFKATDKLSFGFGLDLQYVDVELTQMADLGGKVGFPQAADGSVKLTADDWSWGYNLGLTYQVHPATRLGLAYRSKISHTVNGDGKLKDASGAIVFDEKLKARMTVPESLSFAVHHELNKQWSIMADATWTRWSRFQALIITSENGNFDENKEEKWENSMRYGIGVDYKHNDKWTFRSGIAYDESPVSDDYRTARIPGNDRKWLSVGASYQLQDNIIIDAGYTHLFVSNPKIDETDSNGYTLKGEYEASVDLLAVQVRWLFL